MKLLQASLLFVFFAIAAAGQGAPKDRTAYPTTPVDLMQADLIDTVGVRFNLNEYRGKVVLLHLWATWCGPAIAQMPDLIALQEKYQNDGLEVIGLNIGDGNGKRESWKLIRRFVTEKKIDYRIVKAVDGNSYTRAFYKITKADVIPQALLIDRNGDLRGFFIGGGPRVDAALKEKIEQVVLEDKHLRP